MATVSAAARLRASLCGRGRYPPVRSWDLVLLLRLIDAELLELHRMVTAVVRDRQDPAGVQPPDGVSAYQAELMARAVMAPPPRDGSKRARKPRPGEAEQRLEGLVDQAEQARAAGEQWLAQNAERRR